MEGTILISRAEEFAVVYGDIPVADQQFGNDKARMDEAVNAMKTDGEVRAVLGQKDIIVGGFPAREVEFSAKSGGWFVARVIIADGRVYVLVAGGRFARSGNENARAVPRLVRDHRPEVEDRRAETGRGGAQTGRGAGQTGRGGAARSGSGYTCKSSGTRTPRSCTTSTTGRSQGARSASRTNGPSRGSSGSTGTVGSNSVTGRPLPAPVCAGQPGIRRTERTPGSRLWGVEPRSLEREPLDGLGQSERVLRRRLGSRAVRPGHTHLGSRGVWGAAPLAEVTVNRTHVTARIAGSNGTVEFKHAWVHDEKWHHVALTRSQTGAQLYFDGAPLRPATQAPPPPPPSALPAVGCATPTPTGPVRRALMASPPNLTWGTSAGPWTSAW
ncbi:hypothetical protein J8F10_22620 [Gemmata sp. G18]|uniref:Laminin G domain-containing protein n=1 Tax=Gemmata palustris TaxID=2822762 RepID=A0ABS5BWM1_9BACT|nr:hypothetical protein [Gemmata palustris]MBP3958058.1 hypothetical protein [Gemmata palustris]